MNKLLVLIFLFSSQIKAQSFYSVIDSYAPPEGWTKSWTYDSTFKKNFSVTNYYTFLLKNENPYYSIVQFMVVKMDIIDTAYYNKFIKDDANKKARMEAKLDFGNEMCYECKVLYNLHYNYIYDWNGNQYKSKAAFDWLAKSGFVFYFIKPIILNENNPYEEYLKLGTSLYNWYSTDSISKQKH